MQVFPREFLAQVAREQNLSPEQEEALTAHFSSGGSNNKVADALFISASALTSRMTGVYSKFGLHGNGPNKRPRLHDRLLERYQAFKAAAPPVSGKQENNLDALVGQVRQAIQPLIQTRCGSMKVLDLSQPIPLGSLYIQVNLLTKIPGRRRVGVAALLRDAAATNMERLSLGTVKDTVPGLEAVQQYRKLMLLGKPGSGKATFLKHLALQCVEGTFYPACVPWFITLRDFAATEGPLDFLAYLQTLIPPVIGVNGQLAAPSQLDIQTILSHGRALLLLDGLDEVCETDARRVVRQLQAFTERYSRNAFVITCRLAARESTFEAFTEVEVAAFNQEQIVHFVEQWFCQQQQAGQAARCLQALREQPPLHDLATRPLLLALLCIGFEDAGAFPTQRWQLYRESLKVLLQARPPLAGSGWEPFYQSLSPKGREAFFRQIALPTFAKGSYFFDLDTAERLTKQVLPHSSPRPRLV